jgi:hypothetical protein
LFTHIYGIMINKLLGTLQLTQRSRSIEVKVIYPFYISGVGIASMADSEEPLTSS